MKPSLIKICYFLIFATLSTAIQAQDRIWTDIEGRKITGRAVAKNDTSVILILANNKKVTVPLVKLDQSDVDWVKAWELPDFKIEVEIKRFHGAGGVITTAREFKFITHNPLLGVVIFEDEIPAFIKAIHEFFELEKKVTPNIDNYAKVLHVGRASSIQRDLLVFTVNQGEVKATGFTFFYDRKSKGITSQELKKLLTFLEGFSISDWDKKQEQIKQQFELN